MIIVEERLKELFKTLPPVVKNKKNYVHDYSFGTQEDLLLFLSKRAEEIYPLIWLETPITKTGRENNITIKLKLIIAINTSSSISNLQRLEESFKPALNPMYKNIIKALKRSGFTRIIDEDKNKRTDYYNYGLKQVGKKGTENVASDIWDAIKLECELALTNCEQKKINY
jgi:hypothetical protein